MDALLRVAEQGYFLYVPRTWVLVLNILLVVLSLVLALPSYILWKWALNVVAPMALVFQFFLAGVLTTQLVGRAFGPRGTRYLSIQKGSDYLAGFVAVVAAISALVAIAMTGLALAGCATRTTPDSLAAWVYQTDTATGGNTTLWLNMTRRPFFYTDLSWFQICLDDKPMAIVFLCVAGALVVLDVMVAVIQFRARAETLTIGLAMTTPTPASAPLQHSVVGLGLRAPTEEEEVTAFMMMPLFTLERKQA